MSGTSLDGLDIAYCKFTCKDGIWEYEIKEASTISYDQLWIDKLKKAILADSLALLSIHNEYGTWLGQQCKNFIKTHKLNIDFISSHGHTIFHQPEKGITYQIGSGQHLANSSGYQVICDFRSKDVSLQGQGAPLVPIGDELLFKDYDFCLNLGGFSNISFRHHNERIAFDISPANIALNFLCQKINKSYDDKGAIAQSGYVNQEILTKLDSLPFYEQQPPKSLGYEWFEEKIIPILENSNDSVQNLLHTTVKHISRQIAKVILENARNETSKILITGGGAKNTFLIDCIKNDLSHKHKVEIPDNIIIDYKEALIFAFLGVLRSRNEVNCLKSVTGATIDSSAGIIYYP